MAVFPAVAGPSALLGAVTNVPPSLAILVLLSGVVVALIYAYQPPLPQTLAFAFLPWVVTGSFLNLLASNGGYPSYLVPLLSGPGAYLTALFVPGLAWAAMLNVSVSGRKLPAYHQYIGTMGAGVVVVLVPVMLLVVEARNLSLLLVLVVVPLVSLFCTGLIAIFVGYWSPDFVEYAAIAGGFAVFGALVNGISTTMSVAVNGQAALTPGGTLVRDVVLASVPQGVAGLDVAQVWAAAFILVNVAIGVLVATQLARVANDRPRTVYGLLGLFGSVGFVLGFNQLLAVVV